MGTTPFNEEQKKRVRNIIAGGIALGFTLGFMISMAISKKRTDKLEAKILKLEGWQ